MNRTSLGVAAVLLLIAFAVASSAFFVVYQGEEIGRAHV